MDRGRVGYNMIGNKEMREHLIKSGRKVHLERIRKIKMRKPGTSNTLDNTAPHVIPALKKNPRKLGKMKETNMMIERENKSLLKRISVILTAPPKINDEDYYKMKGLCQSMRGPKEIYEENLLKKHHKRLMKHLKETGPFYSKKEWETSYRKQKIHQKFMREVTYKRPPGFVDPLADNTKPRNLEKERREKIARRNRANQITGPPASQSKRVKELKNSSGSGSGSPSGSPSGNRPRVSSKTGSQGMSMGSLSRQSSASGSFRVVSDLNDWNDWNDALADSSLENSDAVYNETSEATGIELSEVERMVKVLDDSGEFRESHETLSVIKCCLVDGESLLISAHSKQEPSMSSIAEVDLTQLAELKGFDEETKSQLNMNANLLEELSTEVASSVEFRIDDGVPRLLLNIGAKQVETILPEFDEESQESLRRSIEFKEAPYVDNIMVPVDFKTKEILEGSVAFVKPRSEYLKAQLTIDRVSEAVVCILLRFTQQSKFESEGRRGQKIPAVPLDCEVDASAYLPSIARADADLALEFYGNLASDIRLEHNCVTLDNSIVLPEVERDEDQVSQKSSK